MKLGIVGSRRRNTGEDYLILVARVLELQPDMIISGGCPKGADKFAEEIAKDLGIAIVIYHPELEDGKKHPYHEIVKANYARNKLIAAYSDYLIALVAPDRRGGTENTINYFKARWVLSWKEKLEIL